jgi:large subunit ribosomal protein L17
MRHQRKGRSFGRSAAHRKSMYANLTGALVTHGRIKTTLAKAKEVRPVAEKMVTLGKRGDLHARRRALRVIRSRDVAAKVFGELADRFRTRAGGYTRVMKTRYRVGDAAPMSLVALLGADEGVAAAAGEKPSGRKRAAKGGGAAKAAKGAEQGAGKAAAKKAAPKKPGGRKSAASGGAKSAPRAKAKSTRSKKGS